MEDAALSGAGLVEVRHVSSDGGLEIVEGTVRGLGLNLRDSPGAGWPPRVRLSTGFLLSDDEGVGIGEVAGVAAHPVMGVAEVERMARGGLACGDDVQLVRGHGHQLIGGDDALAHQGGVGRVLQSRGDRDEAGGGSSITAGRW